MSGPRRAAGLWAAVLALHDLGVGAQTLSVVDVNAVVCSGGPGVATVDFNVPSTDVPYVLTFWRTSNRTVILDFELSVVSSGSVVSGGSVTLDDHSTRRLATRPSDVPRRIFHARGVSRQPSKLDSMSTPPSAPAAFDIGNADCEEIFLLGNGDVVSLPETWEAARADFEALCVSELGLEWRCAESTGDLFNGYPEDDRLFLPDDALCNRLAEFAGRELLPDRLVAALDVHRRRLKGGGVSGRSYSSGSGASGSPPFGFPASRVSGAYPRGFSPAAYGNTGMGARIRGYPLIMFMPLSPFPRSRYHTRGRSSGSSNRTTDANAGTTTTAPQTTAGTRRLASQPLDWDIDQDVARDDLMIWGFYPDEVADPAPTQYRLTVFEVDGPDFAEDRICPPENWTVDDPIGDWEDPGYQDLFVALEPMEAVEEDGGANVALSTLKFIGILLGSIAGACCCLGFFVAVALRNKRKAAAAYVASSTPTPTANAPTDVPPPPGGADPLPGSAQPPAQPVVNGFTVQNVVAGQVSSTPPTRRKSLCGPAKSQATGLNKMDTE